MSPGTGYAACLGWGAANGVVLVPIHRNGLPGGQDTPFLYRFKRSKGYEVRHEEGVRLVSGA